MEKKYEAKEPTYAGTQRNNLRRTKPCFNLRNFHYFVFFLDRLIDLVIKKKTNKKIPVKRKSTSFHLTYLTHTFFNQELQDIIHQYKVLRAMLKFSCGKTLTDSAFL